MSRHKSRPARSRRLALPQKTFLRVGEAARLLGLQTSVLRFWEKEFPALKPLRSASGHRLYRHEDVELLLEIKRLLYERGHTIAGARAALAGRGRREAAGAPDQSETMRLFLGRVRRELADLLQDLQSDAQ